VVVGMRSKHSVRSRAAQTHVSARRASRHPRPQEGGRQPSDGRKHRPIRRRPLVNSE
jgi:hypothetical protein